MLIIGDFITDKYTYVKTRRVSPEAPVLIVGQLDKEILAPGGAGLAAAYSKKHSFHFHLITNCGFFGTATLKRKELFSRTTILKTEIEHEEIVKQRYIDITTNYHLLRVDNDSFDCLGNCNRLLGAVTVKQVTHAVALLLDYRKGMFSNTEQCQDLLSRFRNKNIITYVDSRRDDLLRFKGADIIKLNELEYKNAKERYGNNLIEELEVQALVVTRGDKGATLFFKDKKEETNFTIAPCSLIAEVTGAGDVFDSNCCHKIETMLTLDSKQDLFEALRSGISIACKKATQYVYEQIETRL
ncbi:MAG: hypothetical protein DRH90_13110 [Deltaproteobacteria bacterium]|nr:MAG: hypothetical protein DRH90_13110 [Deltaproteobacteria bacterium]